MCRPTHSLRPYISGLFGLILQAVVAAAPGANPTDDLGAAITLFRAKKYPDARAALEKIVAADPRNAAAAYYLGRTLELRGDADALPEAVAMLQRAAEL